MIRTALETDVSAINALLNECAEQLSSFGMNHWLGVYNQPIVSQNMANKTVWVLKQGHCLVGTIALSHQKPDYYLNSWPDAPEADYYISQFAVRPDWQGQGYGKKLIQHCIQKAMNTEFQLDAVCDHLTLIEFYQHIGFEIITEGVGLGNKRYLLSYTASKSSY